MYCAIKCIIALQWYPTIFKFMHWYINIFTSLTGKRIHSRLNSRWWKQRRKEIRPQQMPQTGYAPVPPLLCGQPYHWWIYFSVGKKIYFAIWTNAVWVEGVCVNCHLMHFGGSKLPKSVCANQPTNVVILPDTGCLKKPQSKKISGKSWNTCICPP